MLTSSGAWEWGTPGRLANFKGPNYWQEDQLKGIRDRLQSTTNLTEALHQSSKPPPPATAWASPPRSLGFVNGGSTPSPTPSAWSPPIPSPAKGQDLGQSSEGGTHASITKDIFKLTATSYYHPEYERTWRARSSPLVREQSRSLCGPPQSRPRILLIMDEASAIDDVIWETAEGALTDKDTQIFWLVYGNPTRNSAGSKNASTAGSSRILATAQVDSRTVELHQQGTNRQVDSLPMATTLTSSASASLAVFPRVGEMEFFNAEPTLSRPWPAKPFRPYRSSCSWGGRGSIWQERFGHLSPQRTGCSYLRSRTISRSFHCSTSGESVRSQLPSPRRWDHGRRWRRWRWRRGPDQA